MKAVITDSAQKSFAKIPEKDQKMLQKALKTLQTAPNPFVFGQSLADIETCGEELAQKYKDAPKRRIEVFLQDDLMEQLEMWAQKKGISPEEIICQAVYANLTIWAEIRAARNEHHEKTGVWLTWQETRDMLMI